MDLRRDQILDKIIENARRLGYLSRYVDKMQEGKPLSYEQEEKLKIYFEIEKYQEELIECLRKM